MPFGDESGHFTDSDAIFKKELFLFYKTLSAPPHGWCYVTNNEKQHTTIGIPESI